MYYDYKKLSSEYDEFVSKENYSINPTLTSLQEVILVYLQELSYYLLKLKDMGATNEIIKEHVISSISGIITNVDYNHEQFRQLIFFLSEDLSQTKALYQKLCFENEVKQEFLKISFKHPKNFEIADIMKKGEKHYLDRNIEYCGEQKNLFDIMLFLVKNICIRIIQIQSYKKKYDSAYRAMIILLDTMNFNAIDEKDVKKIIENCIKDYYNLLKELNNAQEEAHGERQSVYISFAPRTGKAILVSGIDLIQLEAVLKATKGRGVDVYTHGITMLMAHTLSKFKQYKHLVGHFGKGSGNSLFDFAAFPGAILTTRYLFQKVEYLYRGRLFTTDFFAPSGIIKIKDNDYEPLIKSALGAKGFTKKQQKEILRVGFRQKFMEEKIQEVIGKMEKNEIKHFYIIGLLNQVSEYSEYFEEFLKLMPSDCYALSLAYDTNADNILHVDSLYDYLFIYSVLEKINEKTPLSKLNITIFITKCDQYTITNIINFVNMGIKQIYLCRCIPALINQSLVRTLTKTFDVKEFSTPQKDLADTLLVT